MSIIKLGPIETLSLIGTTSTVGDVVDKDDLQTTTISTMSTSLASALASDKNIQIDYTSKYLDSLSDTQLAEMIEKISDKEETFTNVELYVNEEHPRLR